MRKLLVTLLLLGAATIGVSASGATFTSSTGNATSSAGAASDWVAPTVAASVPSAWVRGSATFGATASDSGSGVATVKLQYATASGSTYADVCSGTSSPLSCVIDTTQAADGNYKLRAIATDRAANSTTSSSVSFGVDNTAPTASLSAPAGTLRGSQTLTATSSDATSGVAKVTIQRAKTGTGTWTDVCVDTTSPYTCAWDTSGTADGSYDLRAVAVDVAGNTTTSATVTRTVDNTAPTAASIATVNAATAGRAETGDQLVLRFSEAMDLSSIVSGWTSGTSPSFTVRIRNGGGVSGTGGDDLLDFSSTANLGSVDMGASGYSNAVGESIFGALSFSATATASTVSGGTQLTITLGTRSAGVQGTVAATAKPTWTPSASATDAAGNAAASTPVTQTTATKGF